jgi:hypothetical protein
MSLHSKKLDELKKLEEKNKKLSFIKKLKISAK